jgi:hypothetical protein
MRILLSIIIIFCTSLITTAQNKSLTAKEIVANSINYHDPEGKLLKKEVTLHLTETRPNGSDRKSQIKFHLKKEKFQLIQVKNNHTITSTYKCGNVSFLLDGKKEISAEDKEKYRLDEKRLEMLKNYYQYLWLMPLKLNDEGSNFNPLVKRIEFFGKESLEIQVTYDQSVGTDVWYFYFNPETFALQGYRFYHNEEKNDGEYIILDDEVLFEGVRLPKSRKWFTHKEDKFLGTDILDTLAF